MISSFLVQIFGCDYVVSATGATAHTPYLDVDGADGIARAVGGEVLVDEGLQSVSASAPGVFAAGDCCQVCLFSDASEQNGEGDAAIVERMHERHWFQMKLWSQVSKESGERDASVAHTLLLAIWMCATEEDGVSALLLSEHARLYSMQHTVHFRI
jgi:hypothetical protein